MTARSQIVRILLNFLQEEFLFRFVVTLINCPVRVRKIEIFGEIRWFDIK